MQNSLAGMYMYIPANEFCMRYAYVADLSYKQGQLFTGVTVEHFSRAEQAGVLRAFDVNQNKIVWEWSNRTPLISHTLTTAGDLVFRAPPRARSSPSTPRTARSCGPSTSG